MTEEAKAAAREAKLAMSLDDLAAQSGGGGKAKGEKSGGGGKGLGPRADRRGVAARAAPPTRLGAAAS